MKYIYIFICCLFLYLFTDAQDGTRQKISTINGSTINLIEGMEITSSGNFTAADNPVGYVANEHYVVVLHSTNHTKMKFSFRTLNQMPLGTPPAYTTVCTTHVDIKNTDHLKVYDGNGTGNSLLYDYTNLLYTTAASYPALPVVVSSGEYLTIEWTSALASTGGYGFRIAIGCPPGSCSGNKPAGDSCSNATPICNVLNYCGNTSYWYSRDLPGTMCDRNLSVPAACNVFPAALDNNSWLIFQAASTTVSLDLTVANCVGSGASPGVQFAVYDATNCNSFVLLTTNPAYIVPGIAPGLTNITIPGLTVGKNYYIMIDGLSGDICDYWVKLNNIVSISAGPDKIICTGSSTSITASGGSNYTWSTGQVATTINITPTITTTYIVTGVPNFSLCINEGIDTAIVTVNNPPTITANNSTICSGNSATITGSGGVSYTWSTVPTQTGSSIIVSPTTSTTYIVTGADAGGCTSSGSAVVTIYPLLIITTTGNAMCQGKSASITASGANSYTWSSTQTGSNINVNPTNTTTYYLTSTDGNGCTNTASAVVTVFSPPVIIATGGAICQGISTNITASGGTSYTWSTTQTGSVINVNPTITTTYIVTGTDNNTCTNTVSAVVTVYPLPIITATGDIICIGTSGIITASGGNNYTWNTIPPQNGSSINVSPTTNTTYYVTGTDVNSCTGTASCTVAVSTTLVLSTIGDEICNGATATISVSGGQTYTWNTTETNQSINVSPTTITTYSVTGAGTSGCTGSATAIVFVSTNPIVNVADAAICYGVSTTLTASVNGGTPNYLYTWAPGVMTNSAITVSPAVTTTYFVTISDSKGCTGTTSVVVIVSPLMQASITNKISATCGLPNGTVTIAVTGGTPFMSGGIHYNYKWNTPGSETSPTATNLPAGTYTLTITDSLNCSITFDVVIGNSPPVTVTTTTNASNCGKPDGSATANPSGGTPGFTYIWSTTPSQTSQTATNIPTGTYTVTVTDSKSCTVVETAIVGEINPLLVSIVTTPEHCGHSDGTATAMPSGGNNYKYLWNTSDTINTIDSLSHNNIYSVTISEGNCKATNTTLISETSGPKADFTYTPAVLDIFENTTALFDDHSTQGGQPIIRWHWDFYDDNSTTNIRSPMHSYKDVGTYTVCLKVTDSKNCEDNICKLIVVKDIFTVYIPNAFSPNSDLLNEGFIPQGYRIDPDEFTMIIFNRWGEEIYRTHDFKSPWNGRFNNTGDIVQIGVYIYRIIIKEIEGTKHEFIGRVSVIR
ncbi:MAG: gliding motility-associated C-terminal domain-containing protein [Bacteroidales bacterium]